MTTWTSANKILCFFCLYIVFFNSKTQADGLAKGLVNEIYFVSADNGEFKKGAVRIALENSDNAEFNSSTCNNMLWLDSKDVPASKELISLVLTSISAGRPIQFSFIDPPNWSDACKLGQWIKLR